MMAVGGSRMRVVKQLLLLGIASLPAACVGGGSVSSPTPDRGDPRGAPLTVEVVDSLYQRAEALFRQGKWTKAQQIFNRVGPTFSGADPRMLRHRFYLAEISYAQGDYLQAARDFRRIADDNPEHPLAAPALYRTGEAYAELWRKPQLDATFGQTAMLVLAEVSTQYPGTLSASRAQRRFLELQGWYAFKEYQAANFYMRYKAYDSALLVLRELVAKYPQAAITPTALLKIIEAYEKLGYVEDREETCEYVWQYYPGVSELAKACPRPTSGGQ